MISKWRWLLDQLAGRLWVRATFFAVVGVATALLGVAADAFVPVEVGNLISSSSVGTLLNVLATSMLAVTTFSLGVIISAYSAATSNVTPRATSLLRRDSTSQNVLSTFIGSFLFSLVGIITLTIEGYGERGRLVLFIVTIAVILLVVATILRWIEHVNGLGRVGETTSLIERTAIRAVETRRKAPYLGGRPLLDPARQVPAGAIRVEAESTLYVQHIDVGNLHRWAEQHEATIFLACLPGTLVHPGREIGWIAGATDLDLAERERAMRNAFTFGDARAYEQDPRFGIIVLAEIGARAMSAAINDPGTAIDVIARMLRVLVAWARPVPEDELEDVCERVFVPPLSDDDLFDDAFAMIARDGAASVEVQVRLQKALAALSRVGDDAMRAAARRHSGLALERAEAALAFGPDRERVRQAATLVAQ